MNLQLARVLPILAQEIKELLKKTERTETGSSAGFAYYRRPLSLRRGFLRGILCRAQAKGSIRPRPPLGMIILDVVDDRIMQIEVLYRDEVRQAIQTAIP